MVVHACDPNSQDAEAGGLSFVLFEVSLENYEMMSQNSNNNNNREKN